MALDEKLKIIIAHVAKKDCQPLTWIITVKVPMRHKS